MPQSRTLDGGLDVHTDALAVADVTTDHDAAVSSLGTSGTRPCDIDPLSRTLRSKANHRLLGDEAGPWSDWRDRDLTPKGQPRSADPIVPNLAPGTIDETRGIPLPLRRPRLSPVPLPSTFVIPPDF